MLKLKNAAALMLLLACAAGGVAVTQAPTSASAAIAAAAPVAGSGAYLQYSCRLPDGTSTASDGWVRFDSTGNVAKPGSDRLNVINNCDAPVTTSASYPNYRGAQGLFTKMPAANSQAAHGVGWAYLPPAGTTLLRMTGHYRLGVAYGGPCQPTSYCPAHHFGGLATLSWSDFSSNVGPYWAFGHPLTGGRSDQGSDDLNNSKSVFDTGPLSNPPAIYLASICNGTSRSSCDYPTPDPRDVDYTGGTSNTYWSPPTTASYGEVSQASALLGDSSAPTVTNVTGGVAAAGDHSGTQSLSYDATDVGGGLYRTIAELRYSGGGPWKEIASAPIDVNGGACVDAGADPNDDWEFTESVPCKAAVTGATIRIDNGQIPAGHHLLRVVAEDAGGNRTAVIPERDYAVAGGSKPPESVPGASGSANPTIAAATGSAGERLPDNGDGASRQALLRLDHASRTVRYGRTSTITGRLVDPTNDDAPIKAATVLVDTRSYVPKGGKVGPAYAPAGRVTTDANGAFAAQLPAGSSRALYLTYTATSGDSAPNASAEARVLVRAGVTSKARGKRVRRGQSTIVRGQVLGQVPKSGVTVQLLIRRGKHYVPSLARPVRTKATGRYTLRLRWGRVAGPSTFTFAVAVRPDSGFPYASTRARPFKVHARP